MSRLTEQIICVDCGTERMVTKACLKMVTRCKPCQKDYNRDKARNRYRDLKNIPTNKPVAKKKTKAKKVKAKAKKEIIEETPKEEKPRITPEQRKTALERMMEITDKYPLTTDDW